LCDGPLHTNTVSCNRAVGCCTCTQQHASNHRYASHDSASECVGGYNVCFPGPGFSNRELGLLELHSNRRHDAFIRPILHPHAQLVESHLSAFEMGGDAGHRPECALCAFRRLCASSKKAPGGPDLESAGPASAASQACMSHCQPAQAHIHDVPLLHLRSDSTSSKSFMHSATCQRQQTVVGPVDAL
jgi:hypothetical protein